MDIVLTHITTEKQLVPELRFSEFTDQWKSSLLEDVSSFYDNLRVALKQEDRALRHGPYPYYGSTNIIDHVDDFIFDGEYVLFAEDGWNIMLRSQKLAFVVSGKFWVNNHAHVIQAHGSNHFLAESLERIDYKKYNTGTRQPKLNGQTC